MLDNEGQAMNLKKAASNKASVFEVRKRATHPDRIHVWKQNFELDNFEDAEIARRIRLVDYLHEHQTLATRQ